METCDIYTVSMLSVDTERMTTYVIAFNLRLLSLKDIITCFEGVHEKGWVYARQGAKAYKAYTGFYIELGRCIFDMSHN